MNGLIVAHLLARRHQRRVCVIWPSFHHYFREKDRTCEHVHALPSMRKAMFWNFGSSMSPREVLDLFQGNDTHILFSGNEWIQPSWPDVPEDLWSSSYVIIDPRVVPRHLPCVAHLRLPDKTGDSRAILSLDTIRRLAERIPACHLITNHVAWYEVVDKYGWTHPSWHNLSHSATSSAAQDDFPLWSDWMTIHYALHVIHTPSAFSESAIRLSPRTTSQRLTLGPRGALDFSSETWS